MGCGARFRGAAELAPTCVMKFADGARVLLAQYILHNILHTHEVRTNWNKINLRFAIGWAPIVLAQRST